MSQLGDDMSPLGDDVMLVAEEEKRKMGMRESLP